MSSPKAQAQPALPPNVSALPAILSILYGRLKRGKTTRLMRDFCRAAVVGVPANIEAVARNACGYIPRNIIGNIANFDQLEAFLDWMVAGNNPLGVNAVYVDDFSLLASASMQVWDAQAPVGKRGKDDFYKYARLDGALDRISHRLRYMGIHGVLSCHAQEPTTKDGTFYVGGPEVPSRKQVDSVPSWADMVSRMEIDPESSDPWWPVSFYTDPLDPQWIGGDRFNVLRTKGPANFREALRASRHQYLLPYPEGLDWLAEAVTEAAQTLRSGTPPVDVHAAMSRRIGSTGDAEAWTIWAVQDAVARVEFEAQAAKGRFPVRTGSLGGPPPLTPPPPAAPTVPPTAPPAGGK